MMPLSRGAKAHLPPKIYGLSRYPRSPPSAHMIKEAAVLGTWQQACSHPVLTCAWSFVKSSPLQDAKASNLSQSETQSHSISKKILGCKSNNTSFENYFRLNSSSGHSLQGWKLGPTEGKSKTPADLSRTWLQPKANFSSLSQAQSASDVHFYYFCSLFVSPKGFFCSGHPRAVDKMKEI